MGLEPQDLFRGQAKPQRLHVHVFKDVVLSSRPYLREKGHAMDANRPILLARRLLAIPLKLGTFDPKDRQITMNRLRLKLRVQHRL